MISIRQKPYLCAALLLVVIGLVLAGWKVRQDASSAVDPDSTGLDRAGEMAREEGPSAKPRRDAVSGQKALAQVILNASLGREPTPPDLSRLSVRELNELLDALEPALSSQPPARKIFCYQMVMGALQAKDTDAALAALENLSSKLPGEEIQGVWLPVADIFFRSVPPETSEAAVAWLKDHRTMFGSGGQDAGPEYRALAQGLALSVARQDMGTGLRAMEDLGLPASSILPSLAQDRDSAEDWAQILNALHACVPGESTDFAREVLVAADAKIGQMSVEEGIAWLEAAPFSQDDLVSVLSNIEAGPLNDPQLWLDWMQARLTASQVAEVRGEWSKRLPSLSAH